MKKPILLTLLPIVMFSVFSLLANTTPVPEGGDYILVVEGYDWGPAVNKVILSLDENVSSVDMNNYSVVAERKTECVELKGASAKGERTVVHAYISDAKGNNVSEGNYITLVLFVSPKLALGSPIQYTRNDKCSGNNWVDYHLTITNTSKDKVWNKETGRIIPLIDQFDLTGRFSHKDKTLSYASFKPKTANEKSPLIIWLHGGGEGGTDPSIPLIANRAANYASPDIQLIFEGAYVLAPQSPTFWMDNGEGSYTRGQVNDTYNESVMALIKDFVAKNPGIDKDRIYVGGCSNGGYLTLKLVLLHPDYFAAAFPSALAYHSEFLTDEDIQRIKNVPIWFIHSKDDPVTVPDKTAVPVYQRLMAAGALDVHFSYYDHVVDITGFYGGDGYHYNGHWSWIYSHANLCRLDYDGKPVTINNRPVTVMEWMAAKRLGRK